ncbi:MAG: HslU--HslV peptidase ATPase subunit [Campylobacterales bacterium]|nr:HslU--HslV peptidase ATPase subunit [Campylobacterales bacterium]
MDNLTPKEIVEYLDKYVIGQKDAKKTIAVALRNRYRRLKLPLEIQEEIIPKNILMIGSTGVGKTEIARRLAQMMQMPFVKVEASKYTEVGFVGRDVESMIRDLAIVSLRITREIENEKNKDKIEAYVENKILEKLIPPLPMGASEQKKAEYELSFAKMQDRLAKGDLDAMRIKIKVLLQQTNNDMDDMFPSQMVNFQESIIKVMGGMNKNNKEKEVSVKEAKRILQEEASEQLFDMETLKELAKERVEKSGIVFIDEIDKIAVSSSNTSRQDPSKEGVQRDLLPIVEGSNVNTKLGVVKTDHILFIAAGAFHLAKPSDLIPELQGRFPLKVALDSLDEDALYRVLTEPRNSLIKQYEALLSSEDVRLVFEESALRKIASYAMSANDKTEDIGARRLYAVVEKVLEDINFEADMYSGKEIMVDESLVDEKLSAIIEDEDSTRYIL